MEEGAPTCYKPASPYRHIQRNKPQIICPPVKSTPFASAHKVLPIPWGQREEVTHSISLENQKAEAGSLNRYGRLTQKVISKVIVPWVFISASVKRCWILKIHPEISLSRTRLTLRWIIPEHNYPTFLTLFCIILLLKRPSFKFCVNWMSCKFSLNIKFS